MVRVFERYLRDIGRQHLLTREEEVELARRSREGDERARRRLVSANLRFVVSIAKRYRHSGLSLGDLVNEGNLGLLRAAARYDETRGVRFVSYAAWWVRQAIIQAILASRDPPGPGGKARVSIDEPLGAGLPLREVLPDERSEPPERRILDSDLRDAIDSSLTDLPEREERVLRLYFGLDGGRPLALGELGEHLGVTRERARQIKERALSRLRAGAGRHGLSAYCDESRLLD